MTDHRENTSDACTPPCTPYCELIHLTHGRVVLINIALASVMSAAAWLLLLSLGVDYKSAAVLVCVAWSPTLAQQVARRIRS